MPDYKFCVSLNISHPEIEADIISEELNITPHITHKIGEPRITPNGRRLSGSYENTFWSYDFCNGKRVDAEEILFEDFIASKNSELAKHKCFFEKLRETGGAVDYFVGWFSVDSINMNIYLEPAVLYSTADLSISLVLCAYPSHHET
ncbi:DUF4279 domain-containing protein [Alishewanella sp. 16-MA]|uniref:DUF4279 domain-containing protein n=1 Tax=Alishewanella maricola TaxID=2795740 RepID=A0ABS8C7V1_9ALTE|nr:DUF4279 domain-containing protein [Alishewanella maricola]MCB5228423.1 DUF4279 domain-containing protein [Alishewanella maricola]